MVRSQESRVKNQSVLGPITGLLLGVLFEEKELLPVALELLPPHALVLPPPLT